MNHKPLKGVMVGAGFFANFQAEAWRRMPEVNIVTLCDAIPEKASEFAEKWGISKVYSDVAEMLERERPDFIDIVTRPESHLALTKLSAERGIHVICQKPMAPSWDECLAMVDVCAAHNVRLMIHENWRWQPWFREIKRMLDSGLCGESVYAGFVMRSGDGFGPEPYPAQPYFREMERLLIYEMVVHFLDTLRFTAGEIASVYAQLRRQNPVIKGEDCALIQMSFKNGALGLIDANRYVGRPHPTPTFGDFTIEGKRAKIRATPNGEIFFAEYGKEERPHLFSSTNQGYKGDSVKATQEHLISCLQSGAVAESEGREYLKTVAVVFACYESAETGQIIVPKA
ncbi:MAG TPA: Gfo/Idh/MocA family oxidoreductase [Blastocatellia bacterium]|nr:Gfo/Idh/MocA family oxidoreductase [Blastocatellia bacterium]